MGRSQISGLDSKQWRLRLLSCSALVSTLVMGGEDLATAPLGLSLFQGQHTSGTTLLAAGAVLVALPIVVVYIFLQRYFIRGMLEGAVKG